MNIGALRIEWRRPAPELPRRLRLPGREVALRGALSRMTRLEARAVASVIEERIEEVEAQYRSPSMAGSHGDLASCAGASGWLSLALEDFWRAWRDARSGKRGSERAKERAGESGESADGGNGEWERGEDEESVGRPRGYGA